MIGKRPQAGRILVATISGGAKYRAKWRELTADEEATAVAALRELAGGRADLPAEVCGVMEGASGGGLHEPLARQAAELRRNRVGRDTGQTCRGRADLAGVVHQATEPAHVFRWISHRG